MQLNKILKSLVIALPMLTLAACSSTTDTTANDAVESTAQQTTNDSATNAESSSNVIVGSDTDVSIDPVENLTAEEVKKQVIDELRKRHVVYFGFDQQAVTAEYGELLQDHANFLIDNPSVKVLIEGHADERGTPGYNIALGDRRADAVVKYLNNLGVSSSQISTVSYGEEKPVNTSHTQAAFSQNRRAVLVY
ncbi:peptidoglycan-associated lipoprotein Pal [Moritella viscosa]|uniref:Peptidoglycan-associated lipoprotein n=1 Tax=Moritella viscosa TaxID=80854 RepID=A0A090IEY6_9GAMM|nr:peptidoglycan-associated lipoprotein Pal [Moritella viscosa]CED60995.1 peptidoglycan-associated lipoprotein precursor [Moritella viscosa]SGY95357.1 Putative peptidoglycan-associated lipoprotein [Moritella viscosa]SGZ00780.1 Putative peptidoglycan-associated lipoprotein [Moritella viscosa]SGZ01132.1 Putative peptidoglycan-associated lipoprotein [Moritella viscosa]SGZ07329.1 Putative peptidoglycan-associated lipoprotein [Moritella viscosa]